MWISVVCTLIRNNITLTSGQDVQWTLWGAYRESTTTRTFIDESTTSAVQSLQIFKQNYNDFAAKHTHVHLIWCSHEKSHLQRPKRWSLKKNGIACHIDASSVLWALIYNGKLTNQIARLAAIVVKIAIIMINKAMYALEPLSILLMLFFWCYLQRENAQRLNENNFELLK